MKKFAVIAAAVAGFALISTSAQAHYRHRGIGWESVVPYAIPFLGGGNVVTPPPAPYGAYPYYGAPPYPYYGAPYERRWHRHHRHHRRHR